jgi:hypothetical protein
VAALADGPNWEPANVMVVVPLVLTTGGVIELICGTERESKRKMKAYFQSVKRAKTNFGKQRPHHCNSLRFDSNNRHLKLTGKPP